MKTKLSKEERNVFKDKVMNTLLSQPIFEGFKYIKSHRGIVKKTKFGFQRVDMYFHWESYDQRKQEFATEIMNIGYGVRFDVLVNWFEKYCVKTLSDQRMRANLGRVSSMLEPFKEYPDSYDFVYSGEDFEKDLEKMVKDIVEISTYFFNKYKSLEDLYEELVLSVLEGKKELPDVGADWIFEYLTLTKLVDSKSYDKLKQLILSRTRWMNAEPNVARYKDNLDEIFEYLETLELYMPPSFPNIS